MFFRGILEGIEKVPRKKYPQKRIPLNMPKQTKPLSATEVRTAKPKDRNYKLSDGGGLFLLVQSSGSKLWRMKFRFNGKEGLLSFGQYPDVSLQDARRKRDESREMIVAGIDPREAKKAHIEAVKAKTEYTFERIARDWHTARLPEWQPVTARNTLNRLELDIFPVLGNLPIADINHQQIIDVLKAIELRAAETARRLKSTLGRIFSYAIQRGIIRHNPIPDLLDVLNKVNKQHFAAIKPAELGPFLRTLDTNKARLFFPTQVAVHLMMMTFVRTSELIGAEWSEIDLDNGVWCIPWQRMKMGKRKINPDMTDHRIDLPEQAVTLLRELKAVTGGSRYLFPNQRGYDRPMSNGAILMVLRRMGYQGKMTGHGFRTLAASALEELGYRREVIDRALAHKERNKIQAAYFRADFIAERKKMLQDWADYLDELKSKKQ